MIIFQVQFVSRIVFLVCAWTTTVVAFFLQLPTSCCHYQTTVVSGDGQIRIRCTNWSAMEAADEQQNSPNRPKKKSPQLKISHNTHSLDQILAHCKIQEEKKYTTASGEPRPIRSSRNKQRPRRTDNWWPPIVTRIFHDKKVHQKIRGDKE